MTIRKPVILCVDDEQFVLNALNKQLQSKFGDRYEYEFAESAEEAIRVVDDLAEKGYPFVMVISDQIMPGMTGDQFLTYVHKKLPRPIKIMLTGQASLDSAISAINNADLYRYLTKPWQEEDFLLTVEKGLQQYALMEEKNKQAEVFSHFVPHQFLERLNKSLVDIELGDHVQREMTVLFSDIRDFTKVSETMTPEETYNFINRYLQYVEPAINKNNGFIDKYIGDAVMALFDSPEDGLQAAFDIQRNVDQLNQDHRDEKYGPIESPIGLHVGSLMLGIVGVKKRMQGTVISHAVNLASRLQGLARDYGCHIIASEEFIKKLKMNPPAQNRFLGKIRVKGIQNESSIFELIDPREKEIASKTMQTKADFEQGLELFFEKRFAEACVKFNEVLKINPEDKPAKIYLERSAFYIVHGIPSDWYIIQTN